MCFVCIEAHPSKDRFLTKVEIDMRELFPSIDCDYTGLSSILGMGDDIVIMIVCDEWLAFRGMYVTSAKETIMLIMYNAIADVKEMGSYADTIFLKDVQEGVA